MSINTRWDLSVLYKDITDPQIDRDATELARLAADFYKNFRGQLHTRLGDAIRAYTDITMRSEKIIAFCFLSSSVDLKNTAILQKMSELQLKTARLSGEFLSFFAIEVAGLDDAVIVAAIAADTDVAKHRTWIEDIRRQKPHLLEERVESILATFSPFSAGSWGGFFDEFEASLRFSWRGEQVGLTKMVHVLTDDLDPAVRSEALAVINTGLGGHFAEYSAHTLWMVAGEQRVADRERNYAHPMAAQNMANKIPDEIVETLHATVRDVAGPLIQRYYRLKAKMLGLPRLRWSDRNAKLPNDTATAIPFADAARIVKNAYQSFSPTLAALVERMFTEKLIDAPATDNKRGGAFNYSIVLPDGREVSFVFLNYLGSQRDVMTLAHELGHAVHGLLAGRTQGALMCHAPTAYAETASIFGEMTTFNHLRAEMTAAGDHTGLLTALMGKIDDSTNSIVRQIGFSNFEQRLHASDRRLSVSELDAHWMATLYELYGADGDVFTYENTSHLWSYISHFHRPFYVYGYAFGELLTQSLYAVRSSLGDRFEPLYLDMLRAGNTKGVVDLLAPFGLDPRDPLFWRRGLEVSLGAMIDEAEKLSERG